MSPIDVKDNTYINIGKEVNDKDPKFKVGNHIRIHVINNRNAKEIIGTFYEKELQITNQEKFRIEKVIKKKGNKLYVKWK